LATGIGLPVPTQVGFCGVTLAHNVASKSEVDAILSQAVAARAQLTKPAGDVYSHYWEVAYNAYQDLT